MAWRVEIDSAAEHYERKSIPITANRPFSGWHNEFPDSVMTIAAIVRLVNHSTIFELNNVESYRSKGAALPQKLRRSNDRTRRRLRSSVTVPLLKENLPVLTSVKRRLELCARLRTCS